MDNASQQLLQTVVLALLNGINHHINDRYRVIAHVVAFHLTAPLLVLH
jgi:hypothetical protein